MDRRVVLLVSSVSATLHVPFMFLSFCINFPSCSFHLHAYSFHSTFISSILYSPFMFLSFVFSSLHFPFIFLSFSFQCALIFLSFSFQCAFMSFHLPFICMHVPFILHSCPFMCFLKLWKWLYGLARGPSATNGYR